MIPANRTNKQIVIGQYVSDNASRDAVVIGDYNKGKYSVFGFNIEITYADVQSVMGFPEKGIDRLTNSVYKGDTLVQDIIHKLT